MKHFQRQLKQTILPYLNRGRAIIIYGPRRVGKTTLAREFISRYAKHTYFDCDLGSVRQILSQQEIEPLKSSISSAELVIIDEAQRIKNIGLTIKIIHDHALCKQLIVTGSSSLELANTINEPLTGRKLIFQLFPLSFSEIAADKQFLEQQQLVRQLLLFGSYPEVINKTLPPQTILHELTEGYLYKDILELQQIKNPEKLTKLLQALAYQVGAEVSYTELASLVGLDKNTIEHYIDLLEKSFIIFRLPPLSRNLRKGISKLRKIYFYDLGIRNSLLGNFTDLDIRSDKGALWENFCIAERIKQQQDAQLEMKNYFWRLYTGAEVDWVEENEGKLAGFEFTWKGKKQKPASWAEIFPQASWQLVTFDNFPDFISSLSKNKK